MYSRILEGFFSDTGMPQKFSVTNSRGTGCDSESFKVFKFFLRMVMCFLWFLEEMPPQTGKYFWRKYRPSSGVAMFCER